MRGDATGGGEGRVSSLCKADCALGRGGGAGFSGIAGAFYREIIVKLYLHNYILFWDGLLALVKWKALVK